MTNIYDVVSSIIPAQVPATAAGLLQPTTSSLQLSSVTFSHSPLFPTTAVANSSSGGVSRPGAENGECRLLGPFALFVQGALGALALLSLVYKRWRERPQRPVKIWAFDASKQVLGSVLLHIANLLMSMLSSGELIVNADAYQANPCSFYLLNLAIDVSTFPFTLVPGGKLTRPQTTVGIPILIVLLRLLTYGFSHTPLGDPMESIQSGNYGSPPKTRWWLKQSLIYFIGLLGMKFCVFLIFQICPWIIRVGDWALKWTEGNETVQVFFVMLFFPVVMNAIQYYIIDSFIKDQKPSQHEAIPRNDAEGDGDDNDDDVGDRHFDGDGRDDNHSDPKASKNGADITISENKTDLPVSKGAKKANDTTERLHEYDPAIDGEGSGGGESDDLQTLSGKAKSHGKDEVGAVMG